MSQISHPAIAIDLPDALIDVPRRIVLSGFSAAPVRLQSEMRQPDGSIWASTAWFQPDAQGTIDLDRDAPLRGDWQGVSPMAPVWSMLRTQAPTTPSLSDGVAPWEVELEATGADGESARARFTQHFLAPGVVRREVKEDGVVGTLFLPAGDGPHPAIVVMNGSGGGIPEQRAALLAAQGFAALALGYFKAPGLPSHISGTPLERFETAFDWVLANVRPARDFIAVTGQSRGGELSLLLGSRFPERVSAIVAYVPSSVLHGTLRAGAPGEARDTPVWTWQGQALPNVWRDNPDADWSAFDQAPAGGQPIRQAAAFLSVQRNAAFVQQARIPVENIRAPILLISGTDDGFWPSTAYSEQIVKTLTDAGHAWPFQHLPGEGAGHAISFPYQPTTLIAKPHPVAQVTLSGGGSAAANARINERSWALARGFLADAFAAHGQVQ
jgi:dienelactone hydrolase